MDFSFIPRSGQLFTVFSVTASHNRSQESSVSPGDRVMFAGAILAHVLPQELSKRLLSLEAEREGEVVHSAPR